MQTQCDEKQRVVQLTNLHAMCDRISGTCHRFQVEKVTRSRVHVSYSNPNEYGTESPMIAVFPCYPNAFGSDNPSIVLDIIRVLYDDWNGEGWQAFAALLDCPPLFRNPDTNEWKTYDEWLETHNDGSVTLTA